MTLRFDQPPPIRGVHHVQVHCWELHRWRRYQGRCLTCGRTSGRIPSLRLAIWFAKRHQHQAPPTWWIG